MTYCHVASLQATLASSAETTVRDTGFRCKQSFVKASQQRQPPHADSSLPNKARRGTSSGHQFLDIVF